MSLNKMATIIAFIVLTFFCTAIIADVMVQLNVNRPYNDVSEKFVSFTIKPEDLYKALDGPHRKTMTRMAVMLGESYIKFVGDYFFAAHSNFQLRNPMKVVWRGFNRWTRALNWTMIIPVPYTPSSWDPMLALKVLNTSQLVGIKDCIWQLGNDFGSSRAQDYVTELNTLNLMVDSFEPYVDNWRIMGADISAGSSAEETRRYIEMSKDLNTAFGWTQPAELVPVNNLKSYIYENDPALHTLISKKVPVWLSLPQKTKARKLKQNSHVLIGEEVADGLRWAQTLGDAASSGFDAVFRRITIVDLERPTFSFFVTALFKKVMGSRVFPARPLHIFANTNKLYTHCANSVSGGIAFMVVNTNEKPLDITVRSMTKITGTEVWQYTLTFQRGMVLLNNEKVTVNSTLLPQVKVKSPEQPVQLSTPGMSISYWVLPAVNLEHCQFTEVEEEELGNESGEKVLEKRYSSSDRLLRKLIQESNQNKNPLAKIFNRGRRYAKFASRPKRFVLENKNEPEIEGKFAKLLQPLSIFDEKAVKKRENKLEERRQSALDWIKQLMENPLKTNLPLLKRGTRSIDNYFGPIFAKHGADKNTFTRKITEIKKPEKKTKPMFNPDEFDEEEFFKKIGERNEPEYIRVPEGDVHLKHITNAEGEDLDELKEEKLNAAKKPHPAVERSKEAVNEMKPLRLLPTEFYESLPLGAFMPPKMNIGGALNSLLFPEPFSKRLLKSGQPQNNIHELEHAHKHKHGHEQMQAKEATSDIEEDFNSDRFEENIQSHKLAEEFLRTQKELSKMYLSDSEHSREKLDGDDRQEAKRKPKPEAKIKTKSPHGKSKQTDLRKELQRRKIIDYLAENFGSYFGDNDESGEDANKDNAETKKESVEGESWWEMGQTHKKRVPRALREQIPDETWQNNMITKDDEVKPLGVVMPEELAVYYPETNSVQNKTEEKVNQKGEVTHKFVINVKQRVNKLVDFVTHHVNEWYTTLTRHIDGSAVETTTIANIATATTPGNLVN